MPDTGATGLGEEVGAPPNQAATGNHEVHADPAGGVVGHLHHAALARGHQLRDRADVLLGAVDGHRLEWLVQRAIDGLGHHLWLTHGQFETLSAHLLDQHRQRQLAATLYLPGVRGADVDDTNRHVAHQLGIQPASDHARGELVTTHLARQRRGVGADGDRDRRLVHGNPGQGNGFAEAASVSPIMISGRPATATISPATAASVGLRSTPSVANNSVILAVVTVC